jgi:hypothetical protein
VNVVSLGRRAFSTTDLFIPRVTERRLNEQGAGGRSSNAGVKVAVFGATGFLGKHVCNQLGTKPKNYHDEKIMNMILYESHSFLFLVLALFQVKMVLMRTLAIAGMRQNIVILNQCLI